MGEVLLGLAFICFLLAALGALADYLQDQEQVIRRRYGGDN